MPAAITATGVGKAYRIAPGQSRQYLALREEITDGLRKLWRRPQPVTRGSGGSELFWALKDLNFTVAEGDVVGVIGRNGAGKSTLLKVLSRITEPSTGSVMLRGRVASLLEVGTGFHPELTGRENIFLNGAILGMSRHEIRQRFDEIVDFAEIEKFLDVPVKRYSSGMHVRLAFAVAAHLEPEILIVDEVLAVGDAAFQKKCLGTMQRVSQREGRTVLFVSHDMAAVEALCRSCMLLEAGSIARHGDVHPTVGQYLRDSTAVGNASLVDRADREGAGNVRLTGVAIQAPDGLATGKPLSIAISYDGIPGRRVTEVGFSIWNDRGVRLISISTDFTGFTPLPNSGTIQCQIPSLPVVQGRYTLNAFVSSYEGLEDYVLQVADLTVATGDFFGTGRSVHPEWGAVAVEHSWSADGAAR